MSGEYNEPLQLALATQHGVSITQDGQFYQRGKSYPFEMKLYVAAVYMDRMEKSGGKRHFVMQVARRCRVRKNFVMKAEGEELMANDHALHPEESILCLFYSSLLDLPSGIQLS